MMRKQYWIATVIAIMALSLAGCAAKTRVERIAVDEVRDLSGVWNDTDSRLVSEEMVRDMLGRPWLDRYVRSNGSPPVVIVGQIRNLSHEHINVGTFIKDIERELINSGRVEFVAASGVREGIREERADQDVHAREDTRNLMGQEIGADYMMVGTLNTIVDAEGREQVKYYQANLELISMADNRKVWIGQKEIKKYVQNARIRY